VLAALIAAAAYVASIAGQASQSPGAVSIDPDDIGGVVTSANGPEAGVWVIAESRELPTRFIRSVVTDDQGRYLMPDLPEATYDVWVRGYGLIDSPKVKSTRGKVLDLQAVVAPNPHAAAQIYPAGYWYSLLELPAESEFPGTGPQGNGIGPSIQSQSDWHRRMKSLGCTSCHQLGTTGTRTIPEELGTFPSSVAAWERRVQSGQAGAQMVGQMNQLGRRAYEQFADWTDRIAAGEVPPQPPRPEGIERNVVITQWDWARPTDYLHDVASTDRRDPRVNANGPVYGALELSSDYIPVVDPVTNTASVVPLRPRDPNTPAPSPLMMQPSPYWGNEVLWTSQTNVHNPMLDQDGRVWLTARIRPPDNPDYCKEGSSHPSAKLTPMDRAGRHLAFYDPKTEDVTLIGTCFGTHHLMFAMDENNTLWTSGGGQVVGWLNTRMYLETKDEEKSQGWTALILDTNGNGRRDEYVEANEPVDPAKDKRWGGAFYAVAPAPDGSVWGTQLGLPGTIVRLDPGPNPPETALAEVYQPPMPGYGPRGGDVDRDGVYWAALASGHLASFDRRKCTGPLNGPTATGQHCPEGWTLYREPLPPMKGAPENTSAEGSYYAWVDWWDVLGLGENTPISTGNASEGLLVLDDGKWVVMRVPYPNGFYTKWMDGRIDDPNAGWKGRGVWATVSTRSPFHLEGGKENMSQVVKFQIRPDPLAK
jgi:hypothetical protein